MRYLVAEEVEDDVVLEEGLILDEDKGLELLNVVVDDDSGSVLEEC